MKLKITVWLLLFITLSSLTAWAGLNQTQVSQLYVAIFNRASEGEGNTYWQTQPDMATAATTMLDTDAARNYFGESLNSNQAFIEHIYVNTLNKTYADDPDGVNYWVDELNTGKSREEVVTAMVGVIKEYAPDGLYYDPNDPATIAAYNQFTNRVEVSNYMAEKIYDTPSDWETSTAFDKNLPVTYDMETVLSAKSLVDRMVNGNVIKTEFSIDTGTLESAEAIDADSGAFNFTDDASMFTNVVINNFSSDDTIAFISAEVADYAFSNDGSDVILSYNFNDEGTMNIVQLTGIVSSDALVYDLSSFTAAIGFDPFTN